MPVICQRGNRLIVSLLFKQIAGKEVAAGRVAADRHLQRFAIQELRLAGRSRGKGRTAHRRGRHAGLHSLRVAECAVRAVKAGGVTRRTVGNNVEAQFLALVLLHVDFGLGACDILPGLHGFPGGIGVLALGVQGVMIRTHDRGPVDAVCQCIGAVFVIQAGKSAGGVGGIQPGHDGVALLVRQADLRVRAGHAGHMENDVIVLPALAALGQVVVHAEFQRVAACIVKLDSVSQIHAACQADGLLLAVGLHAVQFDGVLLHCCIRCRAVGGLGPAKGIVQLVGGTHFFLRQLLVQRRGLQSVYAGLQCLDLTGGKDIVIGFVFVVGIVRLAYKVQRGHMGVLVAVAACLAHDFQAVIVGDRVICAALVNRLRDFLLGSCPTAVRGADAAFDRSRDDFQILVVAGEGFLRQIAEGHGGGRSPNTGLLRGQRDILACQACAAGRRLTVADVFADEHDAVDGLGFLHLVIIPHNRCIGQIQADSQVIDRRSCNSRICDGHIALSRQAGVPLIVLIRICKGAGNGGTLAELFRPHERRCAGTRVSNSSQGSDIVQAVGDGLLALAFAKAAGAAVHILKINFPLVIGDSDIFVIVCQHNCLIVYVARAGTLEPYFNFRLGQCLGEGLHRRIAGCTAALAVHGGNAHDKVAGPAVAVRVVIKGVLCLVDHGRVYGGGIGHIAACVGLVHFQLIVHSRAVGGVLLGGGPAYEIAAIHCTGAVLSLLTALDRDGFRYLVRFIGLQHILIIILDDFIGNIAIAGDVLAA